MQVLLQYQKFYLSSRLVVTILLSDEQEDTHDATFIHAHAHTSDSNKHLIKDELSTILMRRAIII